VSERLTPEVAEQREHLRKERAATLAEEHGQIPARALVRTDDRVPGQPVLLSESLVIHGPILNRAAELALYAILR
jgi:hypothetical protein